MPVTRALPVGMLLGLLMVGRPAQATEPTKEECIAANETAQDLRRDGKLREARKLLAECISPSCPGALRQDCVDQLSEVDSAMPAVVFEVKDESGADVTDATLTVDGLQVPDGMNGTPVPLNPGAHLFRFDCRGQLPLERRIVLLERERRRERIVLASEKPAMPPADEAVAPVRQGEREAGDTNAGAARPLGLMAAGVVGLMAIGGVGLGIGIGAGLASTAKHSHLKGECGPSTCPTSAAGDLDSFHSLRTASTVGYIIGAAGFVGGGVLFLAIPRGPAPHSTARLRPWIGLGSAGVGGDF